MRERLCGCPTGGLEPGAPCRRPSLAPQGRLRAQKFVPGRGAAAPACARGPLVSAPAFPTGAPISGARVGPGLAAAPGWGPTENLPRLSEPVVRCAGSWDALGTPSCAAPLRSGLLEYPRSWSQISFRVRAAREAGASFAPSPGVQSCLFLPPFLHSKPPRVGQPRFIFHPTSLGKPTTAATSAAATRSHLNAPIYQIPAPSGLGGP